MDGGASADKRIALLEKINEKLTSLNWITAQIAGEQNLGTIFHIIVNGFEQLTGVPKCGLIKWESGVYKPVIVKNRAANNIPVLCDAITGVFNIALRERVVLVRDVRAGGYCKAGCYRCNIAGLQVCTIYESNGNPFGVLCAYGQGDIPDLDTLFMIMELYSMQTGLILENTMLNRKLVILSITDSLTGLYNHRYFYERVKKEVACARDNDKPLTLLIIDVDDFKNYNDTYGHLAGDYVLKTVADLVKNTVGERGLSFRYGGEEMAVILPGINTGEGVRIGWDICRAIESYAGFKRPVTVSTGVAAFKEGSTTLELIKSADSALYIAKASGKNRVVTLN